MFLLLCRAIDFERLLYHIVDSASMDWHHLLSNDLVSNVDGTPTLNMKFDAMPDVVPVLTNMLNEAMTASALQATVESEPSLLCREMAAQACELTAKLFGLPTDSVRRVVRNKSAMFTGQGNNGSVYVGQQLAGFRCLFC